MTKPEKIEKLEEKARKRSAKRSQRKDELGSAAIDALKQLGYARTSLRDIAEMSDVSVGILHYYFTDKTDLIKFCVRKYKSDFIVGQDALMGEDGSPATITEAFAKGLCASIRYEAQTHRLWYDIRSQAMFEPEFEDVVEEIEAELIALVARFLRRIGMPEDLALDVYLMLDSAFRYYLHRYLSGDESALQSFHVHILKQLPAMSVLAKSSADLEGPVTKVSRLGRC